MGEKIEIICVGTELLIGKTLNTNGNWLAKRATTLGLKVQRITTIGDDVNEISNALQEAIQRNPRFIISTGGLGPTFDDMTLEGVAKALGVELKIHDEALKMVEEKYREYAEECQMGKAELTPHRIKMAKLPEGAKPLPNPVGTAPGVMIEHRGVTIISLPGVPSEMEAIFEESVMPLLKKAAGNVVFFETSLEVTQLMESDVAPLIDQTMRDNPYVYIKSHPKGTEKVPRIELHLSTTAEKTETAKNRIGKALIQISEMVQNKGGRAKPIKAGPS
jgi:molybdenum cofactor synthesis domain-containing protein